MKYGLCDVVYSLSQRMHLTFISSSPKVLALVGLAARYDYTLDNVSMRGGHRMI